jgi:hypothetical protein
MPDASIERLRARAARSREMAVTPRKKVTRDSFLHLAEQFEELAAQKEFASDDPPAGEPTENRAP